jgi:hypothetical protein
MDSCLKVDTTLPQRPSKLQRLMLVFTLRSFFDWVVLTCPTASVRLLHRRSWQELPSSNPLSDSFKAKFAEHPFHALRCMTSVLVLIYKHSRHPS